MSDHILNHHTAQMPDIDTQLTKAPRSVNYIWLCPRAKCTTHQDFATRLPLHYFDRIYKNAALYPQEEFNLWLDFRQLKITDRFFLDSHRYLFDRAGIHIRDLNEVSEYAVQHGFAPDTNIALYARADYARVLVLNHLLRDDPDQIAIYSDLDCEDVALYDTKLEDTLDRFGVACGRSGRSKVANGYIALYGEDGLNFMDNFLLDRTSEAFQKNNVNHYGAFMKALRKFRHTHHDTATLSEFGAIELPPMRTLIPYDEDKYGEICPEGQARVPSTLNYV